MVSLDENVKTARSQVENQYQRRADLVPNLVATVQGIANQERIVFTQVVEARAKVGQVTVQAGDAQSLAAYQQVQNQLGSSLARLLAIVENYPDIKSNQNF